MAKEIDVPAVDGFENLEKFAKLEINSVNWPESYPYAPKATASIGHTRDAILIRFDVTESNAKADCLETNGPVWEDSCVEFFVKRPETDFYFNFETNCIGAGLSARRHSRYDPEFLSPEKLSRVIRRSSLPFERTDIKGDSSWSLTLEIPFDIIECDGCPKSLMANFYKCGEHTDRMHFVSWSPISTANPDFHCPQFFGKLNLL